MLSFKTIRFYQSKPDPHIVFGLCISSQPSPLVSSSPPPPPCQESAEETGSLWMSATPWIQSTASSWCGLTCSVVSSISCKMMMEPEAWSDPGSEYNPEVSCGISKGKRNTWLPLVATLSVTSWFDCCQSDPASVWSSTWPPFPRLFQQLPGTLPRWWVH